MLFNRVISLVIGQEGGLGRELKGLRIAFSISKGSTKNPNQSTVKIWNMSPDTRASVEVIGNIILLKAGYSEDSGAILIFTGNVTRSVTTKQGADWVTELELRDGLLEFRDTKVSLSFAAGATTSQVIGNLATKFGLPVRALPTGVEDRQYGAGFAFVGRLRDAMDKACEYMGLEWSIQNREIQVIQKGGVYKKLAIVVSAQTGMIGSPTQEQKTMTEKAAATAGVTSSQPGVQQSSRRDKQGNVQEVLQVNGYKVKMLLQPLAEPGGYVQLNSKQVNKEFFRIEEVVHSGDTHGNEWHTELALRYTR